MAILIVLAGTGAAILHVRRAHRLRDEAARRDRVVARGPKVFVATAELRPGARTVVLPADVRGFYQATIYAKVAGYVSSISVDKGDRVRRGQRLAVIYSPEIDQQVNAARADLVIKQRTFERYATLVKKDYVAAQDYDAARSAYGVALATLRQSRALRRYAELDAPFEGVVTARYADPGALVPAATGSTASALPLVEVADLRRVRVQMFVQQDVAVFLSVGDRIDITVDERRGLSIPARLSRISRALDPRSRTMLCEAWLDNRERLYPGTFVHVKLELHTPALPTVPSDALRLHDDRPALAVVEGTALRFRAVRPGLDDGKVVQIVEGVRPGEKVALSIPSEIADGATVQPIERGQAAAGTVKHAEGGGGPPGDVGKAAGP
jgi:RND family efflux transporter MFP subunit